MKKSLNLIPPSTLHSQEAMRVMQFWIKTIGALALCGAALLVAQWAECRTAASQLGALNAQFAPLSEMLKEQRVMSEQIEQLENREMLSLRLADDLHGAILLGAVSEAASALEGTVYLTELQYDSVGEQNEGGALRLEGASVDGLAVASFVEQLRNSGVFDQVLIGSTRQLPGGTPALRAFEIECAF